MSLFIFLCVLSALVVYFSGNRKGGFASRHEPITPGEILLEEFLKPMGLDPDRLAEEVGVPARFIHEIVSGARRVTVEMDVRLTRFFGLSEGYWLRAQVACDADTAES